MGLAIVGVVVAEILAVTTLAVILKAIFWVVLLPLRLLFAVLVLPLLLLKVVLGAIVFTLLAVVALVVGVVLATLRCGAGPASACHWHRGRGCSLSEHHPGRRSSADAPALVA